MSIRTRLLRTVACMAAQLPCSCSLCDTDKLNDIYALLSNFDSLSHRVPKASHDEETKSSIKHTELPSFPVWKVGHGLEAEASTRRLSHSMLDKAYLLLVKKQTCQHPHPPNTHRGRQWLREKGVCTLVMPFFCFYENVAQSWVWIYPQWNEYLKMIGNAAIIASTNKSFWQLMRDCKLQDLFCILERKHLLEEEEEKGHF